jgi:hypothetical protein
MMASSRIEWMGYDIRSQKDEGIDHISVKVRLSYQGNEITGEASGPRAPRSLLRLVAVATLNAVRKFFPNCGAWYVEDVVPSMKGNTSYVTVFLDLTQPRGSQQFIGTAFIQEDTQKAVGLATLNAINRFLGASQE